MKMKKALITLFIITQNQTANAGLLDLFKNEEGHTHWQYVANWSSSILILLLSITAIKLVFTLKRAHKTNIALEAIRNDLELRVEERTATLNDSNQLLKNSNQRLEHEIDQHEQTTTLLRSSESYIQNILSSMPLMLIGLNETGEITQWNRFSEDVSGISSKDALGKNLWETYPTITVSPGQVSKALEENEPRTIKQSQRGSYCFSITIYPLQKQIKPGVVILISDETKRVQAENMLVQKDKISSMGELASTMAHDINLPLQAILRDVQTARNQLVDDSKTHLPDGETGVANLDKLLADATDYGHQASAIISNLLAFARTGSDEKQPADISKIMDHTLTLATDMLSAASLKFRDITIERDYQADLPKTPCYESELQQVFLSLLRHACHALGEINREQRTPTIKIHISKHYDAIWVKIQHNGIGLSSAEQQHIFEPFFGNDTTDREYDVGKRLSFSHFIITEHHQGQMALTSDPSVGTTFHMQIQTG